MQLLRAVTLPEVSSVILFYDALKLRALCCSLERLRDGSVVLACLPVSGHLYQMKVLFRTIEDGSFGSPSAGGRFARIPVDGSSVGALASDLGASAGFYVWRNSEKVWERVDEGTLHLVEEGSYILVRKSKCLLLWLCRG